jgi:chromosome segregation ATPase
MMKIRKYAVILACMPLLLVSCNQKELERKTAELEFLYEKQKKDSLLYDRYKNQMKEINALLDTIRVFDDELKTNDTLEKNEVLYKLTKIDSLLEAKTQKIDSLTKELVKLQSKFSKRVAVGKITEGKKELEIKKKYYRELKLEIQELQDENFDLKAIINRKDSLLIEKDKTIAMIREEIQENEMKLEEQQKKLDQINLDLLSAQVELTDLNSATAETYFNLALELKEIADNTSGLFNRNKKTNLINMAYKYFKKAASMGFTDAEEQYKILEEENKYAKFLEQGKET